MHALNRAKMLEGKYWQIGTSGVVRKSFCYQKP